MIFDHYTDNSKVITAVSWLDILHSLQTWARQLLVWTKTICIWRVWHLSFQSTLTFIFNVGSLCRNYAIGNVEPTISQHNTMPRTGTHHSPDQSLWTKINPIQSECRTGYRTDASLMIINSTQYSRAQMSYTRCILNYLNWKMHLVNSCRREKTVGGAVEAEIFGSQQRWVGIWQ